MNSRKQASQKTNPVYLFIRFYTMIVPLLELLFQKGIMTQNPLPKKEESKLVLCQRETKQIRGRKSIMIEALTCLNLSVFLKTNYNHIVEQDLQTIL